MLFAATTRIFFVHACCACSPCYHVMCAPLHRGCGCASQDRRNNKKERLASWHVMNVLMYLQQRVLSTLPCGVLCTYHRRHLIALQREGWGFPARKWSSYGTAAVRERVATQNAVGYKQPCKTIYRVDTHDSRLHVPIYQHISQQQYRSTPYSLRWEVRSVIHRKYRKRGDLSLVGSKRSYFLPVSCWKRSTCWLVG